MTSAAPSPDRVAHEHLVFTSAGERSNVRQWLRGRRNFDLWVTDYGHDGERHADVADFHVARAGKKFPNLADAMARWPEVFARYDAVFVADDDLGIDADGISRLFEIRAQRDLWLLQPGFSRRGVISHPITIAQPRCELRYTNFVEVTCPLFQREALERFMAVYDASLVGWGIDWWYLEVLGPDLRGRVAIVDSVPCVNPHPERKGARPETDDPRYARYARDLQREAWEAFRDERGITSQARGYRTYGRVLAGPPLRRPLDWALSRSFERRLRWADRLRARAGRSPRA